MATKKVLVVPVATATLLLLLLSLSPSPTTANPVLDVEGNPLDVDSKYYIRTVNAIFGGGLRRTPRLGSEFGCPLYVTESKSEVDRGEPVTFIPVEKTQEDGAESAYYIDSGLSACGNSHGIWYISYDPLTFKFVFIASGAEDKIWLSPFQMHRVKTSFGVFVYKLFTCLSTNLPEPVCGYVGLFTDPTTGLKMLTFGTNADAHVNVEFIKKPADTIAYSAAN